MKSIMGALPDDWLIRAWQGTSRPGLIDLGPGYPDPTLLPGRWLQDSLNDALTAFPQGALGYGTNPGPEPLRDFVAARFGARREEVVTTAGTSSALGAIATTLQRSGATVLTESTTYDLAVKLFTHRGVRVRALPASVLGIDPDDVERCARAAASHDRVAPALYVIPTFHNPTGRVLTSEVRARLVEIAARIGMDVIEDLAYLDLSFGDEPVPPPLWTTAIDRRRHVALYTFSKVVAPALRLGVMVTDEKRCAAIAADGERQSGGGPSHLMATALSVAALNGTLQRQIDRVCAELRCRRNVLTAVLGGQLPPGVQLRSCRGGYFGWLDLPDSLDTASLRRAAVAAGLDFAPGWRFGNAHGIRLSLAARPSAELGVALTRLVEVFRGKFGSLALSET